MSNILSRHPWLAGCVALALGAAEARPVDAGPTLHLKPMTVNDPFIAREAFRLLIPADWQGRGEIVWRWHAQYPASAAFTAWNPAGVETVRMYPMIPFASDVLALPGQRYFVGNEIRAYPGNPRGYLETVILPRFRPEVRSYKVLAVEALPEWAAAAHSLAIWKALAVPVATQAARIRIGYTVQGKPVEEEFYFLLVGVTLANGHFWATESASSTRAEAGQLGPMRALHGAMMASFRLDPHWYARQETVKPYIEAVYAGLAKQALDISTIVKEANDNITETIRASFRAHQEGTDRAFAQFDRYIRGVEVYQDPTVGRIELPTGYRNAWINSFGEYILTDNSSYNPQTDANARGTWRRVEKAR